MQNATVPVDNLKTLAESVAEALAQSLAHQTGRPWEVKALTDQDSLIEDAERVLFRVAFDPQSQGHCYLEFEQSAVDEIASRRHPKESADTGRGSVDIVADVLSKAMTGLSIALSAEYGTIEASATKVDCIRGGRLNSFAVTISDGEDAEVRFVLHLSADFVSELSRRAEGAASSGDSQVDLANLKLVMDVELNVSLRFGQCQLPLREVIGLTSGSVIELDRHVDDYVELLLDGRVIAKGEAVIVDGNYGLRVTEIPQPISARMIGL